jgi:hypothetical protein
MVEGKKIECSFIQHPQGPEITSLHPKSKGKIRVRAGLYGRCLVIEFLTQLSTRLSIQLLKTYQVEY